MIQTSPLSASRASGWPWTAAPTVVLDFLSIRPTRFIVNRCIPILLDLEKWLDEVEDELYHELISDLQDGYISLASHRLNNIVKILTLFTVIFVTLGFLAGLYGMNFEFIPELHYKYSYFVVLGLMATIATVLLVVFKRKEWL